MSPALTMRQWIRAVRDRRCGGCHALIARGAPLLEITMHQVTRALIRCPACADADVPTDLAPLAEPEPVAGDFAHVGALARREWTAYRDEE
jgi:hypothetical protein